MFLKKKIKKLVFALFVGVVFLGCSSEIDRAIDKLGGTEKEREEALNILSTTGEDTLPRLIRALNNKRKSPNVRAEVARLIGNESKKLNDKRAIPALIKALDDENVKVKLAVVEALTRIEDEGYIPSLLKHLNDKNKKVRDTIWAKLEEKAYSKIRKAQQIEGFDGESFKKKLKLLEEAVQYNPANHKIVKELVSLYSIKGDRDRAIKTADKLGTFVRKFYVAGPILEDDKDVFSLISGILPEKWIKFEEVSLAGEADFRKHPNTKYRNSTFLVYFYITSSKDQNVLVKIMTEDSVLLFVNREKLMEKDTKKMKEEPEHIINTPLKKGENEFILMIKSRKYPRFSIRVSDTNHSVVRGIKIKI